MSYIVPAPDAADFNLAQDGYIVPAPDAADFNLAELGGGEGVYTLVPGIIVQTATPWRPKPGRQERATRSAFGDAPERPIRRALNASQASQDRPLRVAAAYNDAPEKSIHRRAPWTPTAAQDRTRRAPHDNGTPRDEASRTAPWAKPGVTRDSYRVKPHENGHPRDIEPRGRWFETDRYGQGVQGEIIDWLNVGSYASPVADIASLETAPPASQALGSFVVVSELSKLEKRIKPADPRFITPMEQGARTDANQGLWWGPGGFRDTTLDFDYPAEGGDGPPRPDQVYIIPVRRIYVVTNTASITRVSDGADIPAEAVQLSIDIDSFAWQMTATLAGRGALALVQGTDAQPVEVDVAVNGTTWRVLIDGWGEQEAAGSRRGTVTGRGRAAYLAAPYAAPRDYQEGSQLLAQQLAAQELPPGWALAWTAGDWSVPAGAWSYTGLAPIDAIARLAEAGGAYVQAERASNTILVKQRYPMAPWAWHLRTPDFQVPRDLVIQRGSQKKPGQGRNAVYVHGGANGGIYRRVLRQGTAGDQLLPTIVDPLITDDVPARHRGIAAIAQTMRRSTEQHELPLTASLGGLILPGNYFAVGEEVGGNFEQDWIGLVSGVTVTAQAARDGGKGVSLKVRQALEIERHHEV